jgi:hypothetical protein
MNAKPTKSARKTNASTLTARRVVPNAFEREIGTAPVRSDSELDITCVGGGCQNL